MFVNDVSRMPQSWWKHSISTIRFAAFVGQASDSARARVAEICLKSRAQSPRPNIFLIAASDPSGSGMFARSSDWAICYCYVSKQSRCVERQAPRNT
jgi:hypothetical protein